MGLSDKLASLNFDRYQSWNASKKLSNTANQLCLSLKEMCIRSLQAEDFNKQDMTFAQKHLRILSACMEL